MGEPPTGGVCGGGASPSSSDGRPAGVATLSATPLRSPTLELHSVPATSAWLWRSVRRAAVAAAAAAAAPGGRRAAPTACVNGGVGGCGYTATAAAGAVAADAEATQTHRQPDVLSDAWGSTSARSRWWRRVASLCGSSSDSDGGRRASEAYWARTRAAGRGGGCDSKGMPRRRCAAAVAVAGAPSRHPPVPFTPHFLLCLLLPVSGRRHGGLDRARPCRRAESRRRTNAVGRGAGAPRQHCPRG